MGRSNGAELHLSGGGEEASPSSIPVPQPPASSACSAVRGPSTFSFSWFPLRTVFEMNEQHPSPIVLWQKCKTSHGGCKTLKASTAGKDMTSVAVTGTRVFCRA